MAPAISTNIIMSGAIANAVKYAIPAANHWALCCPNCWNVCFTREKVVFTAGAPYARVSYPADGKD
jgi:aspartate carbamoyltransferase regulatory subunit